jgi:hypothetical protein
MSKGNAYIVRVPVMVDVEIWTSAENGEEAIYSVLNSIPKEVTRITKNASFHFIGFNGEAQSKRVVGN